MFRGKVKKTVLYTQKTQELELMQYLALLLTILTRTGYSLKDTWASKMGNGWEKNDHFIIHLMYILNRALIGRDNISRAPPLTRNKITIFRNCISLPIPKSCMHPLHRLIAPQYLRNAVITH